MKSNNKWMQFFLVIVVLGVGIGVFMYFKMTKKKPQKEPHKEEVVPVSTVQVHAQDQPLVVEVGGEVIPAEQIELLPQASGRVVWMNPDLVPGANLEKGETLLKIDRRDYEFAVAQRKADVETARFNLKDEKGRHLIAKREWELLGNEEKSTPEGKALSLRLPHMERAEAALKAAESSLAAAELNLERTELKVPFNAVVRSENVDLGQLVGPNASVARLVGTDKFWVEASVPMNKLDRFVLPDSKGKGGAEAKVFLRTAESQHPWHARVVRLRSDLEEAGRMARILLEVKDPLNLQGTHNQLPLLLGSYVRVEIEGKALNEVYPIPISGMREGDTIWIKNDENRLEIRQVEVMARRPDTIWVRGDLQDGEAVIVSRLGTVFPGLKLQESEKVPAQQGGSGENTAGPSSGSVGGH